MIRLTFAMYLNPKDSVMVGAGWWMPVHTVTTMNGLITVVFKSHQYEFSEQFGPGELVIIQKAGSGNQSQNAERADATRRSEAQKENS